MIVAFAITTPSGCKHLGGWFTHLPNGCIVSNRSFWRKHDTSQLTDRLQTPFGAHRLSVAGIVCVAFRSAAPIAFTIILKGSGLRDYRACVSPQQLSDQVLEEEQGLLTVEVWSVFIHSALGQ